jgi:hypothetical protein
MAVPFYEKSTGMVVIEWFEQKANSSSPTKHYFEAKPIKLQFHPKDASKIIRVYFEGRMPTWMKRYVKEKEHPFECKEVFQNGIVGWWLANWRNFETGMRPLNSPTIKGSIQNFIDLIPAVVEDYRERLRVGLDVIASNLAVAPSYFEPFGLYYRPEEVTGNGGAIVIDEDLIPVRMSGEIDLDYESRIRAHGRLDRLIFELTTPLSGEEEEAQDSIEESEEEFELSFEEEFSLEFVEEEEFSLHIDDNEQTLVMGPSLQFIEEEGELLSEENEADHHLNVEAGSTDILEESNTPEWIGAGNDGPAAEAEMADGEEPQLHAPVLSDPDVESEMDKVDVNGSGQLQLHVVENSSRKHCTVSGQLSFF